MQEGSNGAPAPSQPPAEGSAAGGTFTRADALRIVDELVQTGNIRKHCLSVEAFMRGLARHFGEDEEEWGLVGLLHDADYEATEKDLARHPLMVCEIAAARGAGPRIIEGIKAHAHLAPLDSKLNASIYACDNLAGIIIASALVHPEKKIAALTPDFVLKKFHTKSFARSANRDEILVCESHLGLPLPEFVAIGISSLSTVSDELGL